MNDKANLGLATTAELLAELSARAETGGYADYRTVDTVLQPKEPIRRDANGNKIPWDKEHDYFMGFDPDNPDLPTD